MNAIAVGAALPIVASDNEPSELRLGPGMATVFSTPCPGVEAPNEDSAAVFHVDEQRAVLIVADGLGGRPGGESASHIAVRTLEEHLSRLETGGCVRTAILDSIEEANRTIIALGVGAGTTAAIVEVDGENIRGYHVGDSRILAVGQRGRVKFRTLCHAPTAYAVEAGLLDESEALHHADRHLVSNVIGDASMRIEIGSWLRLAERDTLLLATDGVFDNLHLDEVVKAIRTGSLGEASRRLAQAALRRMSRPGPRAPSKPDDLTFILYRAEASAAQPRALRTCA